MKTRWCASRCAIAVMSGALWLNLAHSQEASTQPAKPADAPQTTANKADDAPPRVTVEAAREQAKLMHNIYETTMDVMHRRYFRADRSVLPARAMEDVFNEIGRTTNAKANWISVNTKAMSINHEPATEFEKQAAREIASGKESFEHVENGLYQRAGRIPLGGSCINCHSNSFLPPSNFKTPRFAGLVIRIPVEANGTKTAAK